jgi:hypothetical protein
MFFKQLGDQVVPIGVNPTKVGGSRQAVTLE